MVAVVSVCNRFWRQWTTVIHRASSIEIWRYHTIVYTNWCKPELCAITQCIAGKSPSGKQGKRCSSKVSRLWSGSGTGAWIRASLVWVCWHPRLPLSGGPEERGLPQASGHMGVWSDTLHSAGRLPSVLGWGPKETLQPDQDGQIWGKEQKWVYWTNGDVFCLGSAY